MQSRAESFVRVFIDIATRGISTLSTKSIALLLNAIEAFSSDRKEYDKALQVRFVSYASVQPVLACV